MNYAELANLGGRLEDTYQNHGGHPARLVETHVDAEGWELWRRRYLELRDEGRDHETAVRAIEGDIDTIEGRPNRWQSQAPSTNQPDAPPTSGPARVDVPSGELLLPPPERAAIYAGNFLCSGEPYLFMLPGRPEDEQERLLRDYAAKGYRDLPFSPYGDYHGRYAFDFRGDRFPQFAAVLDRCLRHGVDPTVFLITDEPGGDGRPVLSFDQQARYLDDFCRRLAEWARSRGAGRDGRKVKVCEAWEVQQIADWLKLSGRKQLQLMQVIRRHLTPDICYLAYHPAPHRSMPHDEITLGGWPSDEDKEPEGGKTGMDWLKAARSEVHLDYFLVNTGQAHTMPEDRVRSLLERGDPPEWEKYRWWGPIPGYAGRIVSCGIKPVLFEHSEGDDARWSRLAAWADDLTRRGVLAGRC